MSKIVCEVCGTSYPETSSQCPICGYIHSGDSKAVAKDANKGSKETDGYNHVKGGRFSKKNVRKRTQKPGQTKNHTSAANVVRKNEKEDKVTVGLVIVVVLLLLAIIAVVLYISMQVFGPGFFPKPDGTKDTTPLQTTDTKPNQSQQTPGTSENTTTDDTTEDTKLLPSCESITLDVSEITFDKADAARMLYVSILPEDTVFTVSFTSDNEAVATVTEDGKVTAVAPGQAVITVTCGTQSAQCTVLCTWEEETTVPPDTTTETVPDTTAGEEKFRLNRKDITFSSKGESWVLYNGSIGKTLITWSSEDETIATIEGGKVVAVGAGTTNVYGEYEGQKVSCIIRCSFSSESENQGVGGNGGGVSEDGGNASGENTGTAGGGYKLYNPNSPYADDISIKVGESFTLQLMDLAGNYVRATWSVEDPNCCSSSENKFTGESVGTTKITASYDGQSFVCIVRVRS